MADTSRLIDWVNVPWPVMEEGDEVWVGRIKDQFQAVGPFVVVSVFHRKLRTTEYPQVTFVHKAEDLILPRDHG